MHFKSTQKSDKELWDLLRKGNKTAFSILYKRHIQALLHFGLKLTPDRELIKDTLQELFIEFWNKRVSLSDVEHVKVYLIKSFRYKLLRAISQANKSQSYELEDLMGGMSTSEFTDNELSLERRHKLKTKLEQLPERQREVIHLRYFQNLKNEEIADIINVNYQSVSNLLHRAVKNLKKQLIAKRSTFLFL
ncbi:MAG: sigma-70 family RNA polymerase sigma factor [Bacteroidetes bacterium]|jgi:RNA polymerase sigma-70 factor (ECF subfamily)|nr:sigma-70 family RNA polymerase sigma factor [Bacteroidota bacterium]MDF1867133.1 sigma-70 family RNA polymerase sigma factor [Saprospiraceae bacterium]